MTDVQTARALWLSLSDPFRMGLPALGGGAVLLIPYLSRLTAELNTGAQDNQSIPPSALFIVYWLFMAPGVRRVLGGNRGNGSKSIHMATIVGMAVVVLVVEAAVQLFFDAVIWPSGFALSGAAFHLALVLIAFVKDACMVRVAGGRGFRAALEGTLTIVRTPNLVIAYALLFMAAFLLHPWGSPWIVSMVASGLGLPALDEIVAYISLLASLYLTLCMTTLVTRSLMRGQIR